MFVHTKRLFSIEPKRKRPSFISHAAQRESASSMSDELTKERKNTERLSELCIFARFSSPLVVDSPQKLDQLPCQTIENIEAISIISLNKDNC
jgi:hypothetical protein